MFNKVATATALIALIFPLFTSAASCPTLTRTLSIGSRGSEVIQLKQFLISQNVLATGYTSNYFGVLTQAAVQQWQKKNNIVSSGTPATTGYGVVGRLTRAAIANVCARTTILPDPRSIPPRCTPDSSSPQTQTVDCPAGQTGSTVQTRTSSCPYNATSPVWSTWKTISNTCSNAPICEHAAPPNGCRWEKGATCAQDRLECVSQSSCTWNNQTVANNASVTAYQSSSVSTGSYCVSETRSCTSGTLSGSYQNTSCTVTSATSCTFNNQTVANGSSITAYQSSTVTSGNQCISQSRTCSNGTLSGTYTAASCTVTSATSCTWNGQTVANGSSITAYQSSSVSAGSSCVSETRSCTNGTLSGSYANASCTVGTPTSCTFNNQTVANGSSVTAYQSSSVTAGSSCVSETRTCSNGTLSGTYTNASCTVGTPTSCTFNGQNISSGSSVTAYQSSSVTAGNQCVSQTRTCTNGTLSGTYTNASCTVGTPASCTWNNQTVTNGASVTAYQSSSVTAGNQCVSQTRTCTNGTLSGTYTNASCTAESHMTSTAAPLCMLRNTEVSNTSDYITNSAIYGTLCGATASVNVPNPGYDNWLDVTVKNDSTCASGINTRIDYWILARDLSSGTILPMRFKSVYQGETSKSHIDLGKYEWNGKSLQFSIVKEIDSAAASCSTLTVQSANVANRAQLIPAGNRADAALKNTFDTRLGTKPGFSNVWDWTQWRRVPVMVDMMAKLEVPFFRTWLQGYISNLYGCNSNGRAQGYDYRYCFANAKNEGLDQMDNAVEELFYHGIPIIANVHGTIFSYAGVEQQSDNYTNPQKFMDLFRFNHSSIWDWTQNKFISVNDRGTLSVQGFLDVYKFYRYDPWNTDLLYGVTQAVLDRYDATFVAVEPGDEQNWHPPAIRSQDASERQYHMDVSPYYFEVFCDYAHAKGKYCIMTSMGDAVTFEGNAGVSAITMLRRFKNVLNKADFSNFHLYPWADLGSYDAFFGFINTHLGEYANEGLLGNRGQRVIITEFGYDHASQPVDPNFNSLITKMREYRNTYPSNIAGSSYWMDIGLASTKNSPSLSVFLISAPVIPFDPSGSCPAGAWCPFVKTCSYSANTCPDYSATGNAWAYKQNPVFWNQFAQ